MGAEELKDKFSVFTHAALVLCAVGSLAGCKVGVGNATFSDSSSSGGGGGGGSSPAPTLAPANYVAGIGATLPGVGASSVPTASGVLQRVIIGVGGRASAQAGNLKVANNQLSGNLSNSTDPTQLSGADANMLLAYAACVDANSVVYGGIKTTMTTAQNKPALVALGMKIVDTYTGGLGSGGSASAQLQLVFSGIVDQSVANGATPQMAYVTVCTAAVTAGSTMLGF